MGKVSRKAQAAGSLQSSKASQGRRIVFLERTLELVDQSGAFLDQGHLVAAQQPQLGNERVFLGQSSPAVAIDAQGIGQTPGIQMVALAATGHFALAVSLTTYRRNRVEAHSTFEQLFDDDALAGFHADGHGAPQGDDLFAPTLPACGTMFDGKIGHDLAQPINDDDIVMIVSPVEARVMSNLFPWFHFCSSS